MDQHEIQGRGSKSTPATKLYEVWGSDQTHGSTGRMLIIKQAGQHFLLEFDLVEHDALVLLENKS